MSDLKENREFEEKETYNGDGASLTEDGGLPTQSEIDTLRHIGDKIPYAAWLVAIVELAERFTYYGLTGPFQNYMQNERHGKNPGALGLGQSTATALQYFFQFWCYVTPIFGAIVADTWLGRYKAICLFAGIYICGLLIIFITSLPFALDNGAGLPGLVVTMIVLGLGTGGIKSNVSPLIAEQYTETKMRIKTLPSGERVILSPAITMQSIFNVFYWCINFGSLSAIATVWMELKIDFWAAYLLPFCFFFIAIFVLIIGKNKYVVRPPKGSILVDAGKALWIGIKAKGNLDAAKPSVLEANGQNSNVPWNDLFVDELKRGIIACKVFAFYPIYWLVYGQMVSNFVSMAGTMETHGLPNDLLFNLNPITIIVFLPFIEKFLYPSLRKAGIPFRPISRIAWGFGMAAVSMVYAAVLQHYIYKAGPCYDHPLTGACSADASGVEGMVPQRIHVALQTPAYVLVGLSEIFANVTGLEYAFTKAPPSMKSLVTSIYLLTNAFGSALGIALSPTSEHPKLVIMFASIAGATALAGVLFWFLFNKYNDQEVEMNKLDDLDDSAKPIPLKQLDSVTKQDSRV
ncbi:PTR2-domain-containing protein [Ascobolus immersus RN42]|uniref:PTR2-domain-containing protein n=1 Tax=Ascobolus immersus RN42 TaxID=1160509 RepID=A0A3N4HQW1_ASCIM|nr:PTR2-domain-containing protein [Ascobolus immersus RN42]